MPTPTVSRQWLRYVIKCGAFVIELYIQPQYLHFLSMIELHSGKNEKKSVRA